MACTFHKKSALFKSAVATATLVQEVGSLLEQAAPVCKVAREPQEGWMPEGGYSEDALVEQPAMGLLAELGWETLSAFDEHLGAGGPVEALTRSLGDAGGSGQP
jgi:hypothetical protein